MTRRRWRRVSRRRRCDIARRRQFAHPALHKRARRRRTPVGRGAEALCAHGGSAAEARARRLRGRRGGAARCGMRLAKRRSFASTVAWRACAVCDAAAPSRSAAGPILRRFRRLTRPPLVRLAMRSLPTRRTMSRRRRMRRRLRCRAQGCRLRGGLGVRARRGSRLRLTRCAAVEEARRRRPGGWRGRV